MAQGHRPDRVGEQIREELSALLSRGAVHDPGIGFITLTRVQLSPDLQIARVFYTTMGNERERRETARALGRATPFLRRELGSLIRLRRVPQLEFRFDESIAHQDRVEQILQDLHREDAERAARQAMDAESAGEAEQANGKDGHGNAESGGAESGGSASGTTESGTVHTRHGSESTHSDERK